MCALRDFEVVKKRWGRALLRRKCCCFVRKLAREVTYYWASSSEERKTWQFGRLLLFCWVLSRCFLVPLGVLLVMKTLEDEHYVDIKAYKFTVFEIWRF